MPNRQEVVVVDGSPETEEVLRAVFEPRGLNVVSIQSGTSSRRTGFDGMSVLVLHSDDALDDTRDNSVESAERSTASRIIIGRIPLAESESDRTCRFLSLPFQYADLISAIEELAVPSRP